MFKFRAIEFLAEAVFAGLDFLLDSESQALRKIRKQASVDPGKLEPDKIVKIQGIAEPYDGCGVAPMSQLKCIAYQLKLDEFKSDDEDQRLNEERGKNFYLNTGSVKILVKFNEPWLLLTPKLKQSSDMLKSPGSEMKKILQKRNIRTKFLGINKAFTLTESVIEPGDKIVVMGAGKWTKDAKTGEKIFGMYSTKKVSLIISNEPEALEK